MRPFLTGLAMGLGVGVLLAPRSGEQTRERLRERMQGWSESGREQAGNLISMAERAADDGIQWLNSATRDDLIAVPGIGPVLADRVLEARPYGSLDELLERAIVPERVMSELRRRFRNQQT